MKQSTIRRDAEWFRVRDERILQWLPLVQHVIKLIGENSQLRRLGTRDDMIQTGTLGLIRAAETFDESRGVLFKSWAHTCIEYALRNSAKGEGVVKVPSYFFDGRKNMDTNPLTELAAKVQNLEPLPDGDLVAERTKYEPSLSHEDDARLQSALRCLSSTQRRLIGELYGLDGPRISQTDIADREGITKQAISYRLKAAMRRLRITLGVRC